MALVPEVGLRISGSDVRGSPQTKSGFIWLLAAGNVIVVEGRFVPTVCCTALKFSLLQQL